MEITEKNVPRAVGDIISPNDSEELKMIVKN